MIFQDLTGYWMTTEFSPQILQINADFDRLMDGY